jgi:hypothetical protein
MATIKQRDNNKCWQDVGRLEPHALLVGTQNGVVALGSSLAVLQTAKDRAVIQPATPLLRIQQEKSKHMFSKKQACKKKNPHPNGSSSILWNS